MAHPCTRSIGLQVSLCPCTTWNSAGTTTNDRRSSQSTPGGNNNNTNSFVFTPSETPDVHHTEMASAIQEDETMETERLLSGESTSRTDETPNNPIAEKPTSGSGSNSNCASPSGKESTPKKEHGHHFQFKRKFNFRSDSVFSDVLPSSSGPSGEAEKSGSLSSLKPKESKWVTLKRKLGKLNSAPPIPGPKDKTTAPENKSSAKSGIHAKRSLLQRAKTLAILPTNRLKEREELPQKRPPRRVQEHPELFNVGGEIDMIPLELLININDLKVSK